MTDHDLFPGFAARRLHGAGAEVFARVGGSGPPLLLVHGYPQTHVCWHKIAGRLAAHYAVVACDLRGYGASAAPAIPPEEDPEATAYAKRVMAADLVAAMEELGAKRFFVASHDRGARVGYRMALDHPERVAALAVLNILPTFAMWERLRDNDYAMKAFRWMLLAQPSPFPEMMIKGAGLAYLHATLSGWTKAGNLSPFDPRALAAYEASFRTDKTIAASAADYRAGWTIDRFHDQADLDLGRKIACPTLALWGTKEFPDQTEFLAAWRRIAANLTGCPLDCGHFPAEEAPDDVFQALHGFLQGADFIEASIG
jgi:haloacetate dehalogenase